MLRNNILSLLIAAMLFCLPAQQASAIILVQVSGLNNLSLPTWSLGDPEVVSGINLCVYSTLTSNYNVTASNSNGFNLSNGTSNIPFSLSWDDGGIGNLGNNAGIQMTNNVAVTNQGNANFLSPVCLAGPNARLNIKITQAAMNAALAGTYTATVTLMISPY